MAKESQQDVKIRFYVDDRASAIIETIQNSISKFDAPLKRLNSRAESNARAVARPYQRMLGGFRDLTKGAVSRTLGAAGAGGVGVGGLGALVLKTSSSFEEAINRLRVLRQDLAKEEIDVFAQMARDRASVSALNPSQVVDAIAQNFLQGLDPDEVKKRLPHILNVALASVTQMTPAESAALVNGIAGTFKINGKRVANMLAQIQASAAVDIPQIGAAFANVGGTAGAEGINPEELMSFLGTMGINLISRGQAGTHAGIILRRMRTPASQQAVNAMNQLSAMGLDRSAFTDERGRITSLTNLLEQFTPFRQESALLGEIVGADAISTFQAVLTNFDKYKKTVKEVKEATRADEQGNIISNVAQVMADIKMEGLTGAVRNLSSAFDELQLSIGELGFTKDATKVLMDLTEMLRNFSLYINENKEELSEWRHAMLVSGGAVAGLAAIASIIPVLRIFSKMWGGVGKNSDKIAKNAPKAGKALTGLTSVLSGGKFLLNPWVLGIAALATALGGLYLLWNKFNWGDRLNNQLFDPFADYRRENKNNLPFPELSSFTSEELKKMKENSNSLVNIPDSLNNKIIEKFSEEKTVTVKFENVPPQVKIESDDKVDIDLGFLMEESR